MVVHSRLVVNDITVFNGSRQPLNSFCVVLDVRKVDDAVTYTHSLTLTDRLITIIILDSILLKQVGQEWREENFIMKLTVYKCIVHPGSKVYRRGQDK